MSELHLLRPEWLLAFIPFVLFLLLHKRKQTLSGQWKNIIAPQLQPYILKQPEKNTSQRSYAALFICTGILSILALAGPSWQKQPSLVYHSQAGLIIGLDLSLSMTAQDVAPSRLQRAKFKIRDILKQHKDLNVGLIVYSGDAHMASPLTRDVDTIMALLPALDPYIMPASGSNLVLLAQQAVSLFEQGKSQPRQLLLLTDGVEAQDIKAASALLKKAKIQLSILTIGTQQGAPIVKPDGSFFKGANGQIIMPGLETQSLQKLANASHGRITALTSDDQDFEYLLTSNTLDAQFEQSSEEVEFDQWSDAGYWLMLPLLLLSLGFFRKGLLSVIVLVGLMHAPNESWADEGLMSSWFLNDNQQAMKQFEQDPKAAAQLFNDPNWKASSHYKAGEFQEAADLWQESNNLKNRFNRANALAQLNQFDEAIKAYDDILNDTANATMDQTLLDDTQFNKALLEQLKEQQDQQKQDGDDSKQDGEESDKNKQDQESKDSDSQDSEQKNKDGSGEQSDENKSSEDSQQESDGQESEDKSENPAEQKQSKEDKDAQEKAEQAREALKNKAQESDENKDQEDSQKAQPIQKTTQQLEQEQSMQQWMERIPDDPGGLLRNKFLYQYKNRKNNNIKDGDRKAW